MTESDKDTVRIWFFDEDGSYAASLTVVEGGRPCTPPEWFHPALTGRWTAVPVVNGVAADGRRETVVMVPDDELGEIEVVQLLPASEISTPEAITLD